MVPFQHDADVPLLPYEKQLIELLGCSEEEYRHFVEQARWRSLHRPAEYDLVPDIRCDPTGGILTSILISLAVGAVLSGVSYLLTPKPKAPRETRREELADVTGASRFAATFGFDSQAELASYGEPIPIVFGRYTGASGGVIVSPKLVWSRMFSYGTQQSVKMMFVVGEQGRDAGQIPQGLLEPDLRGIFLGNGPLDAIYESSFAFYWKRNTTVSGFSRIKSANLVFGTRGTPQSGDPSIDDDIFSCPTARSDNDYGFSSAHSLSNNSEFGCFAPIANGTGYRVNWRIVPMPRSTGGEASDNAYYERLKIAGDDNGKITNPKTMRQAGMPGIGRVYSRRMGIVALNGASVSDAVGAEVRDANVGDVIDFVITSSQIPTDFYTKKDIRVSIDDINSALNEERIAADDALQIGELFMIGRTTWQVINRSIAQWRPEDSRQQIVNLRCIDVNAPALRSIGVVSPGTVLSNVLGDAPVSSGPFIPGGAFYPLMRFAKGTVRNTRPCEVTEIGIRSNVYQRLNGLCNFQGLPTPIELADADDKNIAISEGTANVYIKRASVFTVFLRPAGLDDQGNEFEWVPLGIRFVVIGNQPTEQYNFLRFKHPDKRQYEFQFIPKNGADMRSSPEDTIFWRLNSGGSVANSSERSILSENSDTKYGRFAVTSVGTIVRKRDIERNNELTSQPSANDSIRTRSYPNAVGVSGFFPTEQTPDVRLTAVSFADWYSNPSGFTEGRSGSFNFELFGSADSSPLPEGGFTERTVRENLVSNRWAEIRYRAQKVRLPAGHFTGNTFSWNLTEFGVVASSGWFSSGQEFIVSRTISGGNPFRIVPGQGTISDSGIRFRVAGISSRNLQQGRSQGSYEEFFGPARNFDFGYTITKVMDLTRNGQELSLTLTSTVIFEPNHWTGETKLWSSPQITPNRDSRTSVEWNVGDFIPKIFEVSPGNPFAQEYEEVGIIFNIQSVSNLELAASQYAAVRVFEAQSQYADTTFYPGLIEKSNASNPEHKIVYVNELTSNQSVPTYDRMSICGLALKASRNFTSLDQLRIWLADGIPVRRFHPDDSSIPGPSNLFSDLVFYLLTSRTAGLGRVLGMDAENTPLINTDDFVTTARFLKANRLFFDGTLGQSVNLREFVSQTAPFFLCNFVISNGKFSIQPALPTTSGGEISRQPVRIAQLFTAGNILEDSFELRYLDADERRDFQAVVRYREGARNQLPQERNIAVRWADSDDFAPVESFDLTSYCTSEHHARMAAKFLLSLRRRITHTISFSTTPFGMNLAPGDYIKVITQANPYSSARNGIVDASGNITSVTPLSDGQYRILYYKTGSEDVTEGTMTVSGGIVEESVFRDIIFTLIESTVSQNVYMIEQLTLNEDNTVQITASEFPCDEGTVSIIATDVLTDSRFLFEI